MTVRYLPAVLNAAILLLLVPEFILFSLYIYNRLITDAGRRLLRFLMIMFPVSTGFILLSNDSLSFPWFNAMLMHSVFICIVSLLFYFELISQPSTAHSSYAIVTCRLLLSVIFIPAIVIL